ncbi:MAG TPA: hypothetical protein VM890_05790, partial [Longimicrobium sp.]|nr:hypothetical protein [Longimicrobium sp.]
MKGASRVHRTLSAMAVLVALGWTPLGAQERAAPTVGDRVRIASPAMAGTLMGDLVAVRGDTLFVRRDLAVNPVAVPLSQVDWMEVRRPRSRLAGLGHGLLYGVPTGLAGGYLLGTLAQGSPDDCADDCGLLPGLGALAGLVTGTVLGGIIGVTTPGGRWVSAPRRPAAGAGGVALSIDIKV